MKSRQHKFSHLQVTSCVKIILENISKAYGKRNIVNNVSLSVAQGEVVGLLGPNGAGKTVTFYTATGLAQPDRGKIWLG